MSSDDRFVSEVPAETPQSAQTAPVIEAPTRTGSVGTLAGAPAEREFTVKQRTQLQLITMRVMRFMRHRLAVASLVIFVAVTLLAFVGGALWPHDINWFMGPSSASPSWTYPMGTDNLGHDYFALVLRGAQQSIKIAAIIAVFATTVGALWGAVSGFQRGWTDSIMMRTADLILTLPLLAVAAVLGHYTTGSWWMVGLVIGGLQWAYVSRVVRGVTLSLREKEFIEASRALGASNGRIVLRHIIPNVMGPVIVNATILIAVGILTETALSFLGFGVQPPDTSLGLLVSQNQTAFQDRPWLFYFPGVFIIIIALTINFIGDGLRDALDPQQTRVRA